MDMFTLEPNLVSGFSFLEERQELYCVPTSGASNSHMIRSGRSLQILDSHRCDQLSRQVISSALGSPRALSDYAIHYWSSFEKILAYPGLISQEDLDEIVPVDSAVKDLATTNWQQHTHAFFTEPSSLTVTGPLLDSVAEARPPAEYKQQSLQIEPVGFTPGQSPDDPVAIRIAEVCQRAYLRAYHKAYRKALRAEMNLSGDAEKAKLAGSVAGKAAGKAERDRVKATLVRLPAELQAVSPRSAYSRAYSSAYRAEMKLSGDRGKARRAGRAAGQAASKAEREQIQADEEKKAGLAADQVALDAGKKAIAERAKESS